MSKGCPEFSFENSQVAEFNQRELKGCNHSSYASTKLSLGEEGGANAHQHDSSEFLPSDETENQMDGFVREQDAQRPRFRQRSAPRQKAVR